MFKSYFLVAFRNLIKNKVFTIINILGLGIALGTCIVAYFNHMYNYDFDRSHKNFESIYRVTCFRDMEGREQEYGSVPATLGLQVKKDIPGIERCARIARAGLPVRKGDDLFPTRLAFVDPQFFEMFTVPIVNGDSKSIENQASILINETMANTLFGKEYPVGKAIILLNDNKEYSFTVGAVFKDFPENSSFRINMLLDYDNLKLMRNLNDADWKFNTTAFFIQVTNKSVLSSINQSLKSYLQVQNRAREDFRINRFNIIPLKDVGASNRNIWSSGLAGSLHPAAIVAPPVMALFILLISCFNFANTSISTFSKRLKEIGLRKTFGGQREQLVSQFLFETLIICTLALFVGIVISEFLVPAFANLWGSMILRVTFTGHSVFWLFLFLLLLLTGFVSGVYPAMYVSSFSPANVFKGGSPFKGAGRISIILLTLQFSISVAALVMGIVFARNSEFQKNLDLGYDPGNLIIVSVPKSNFTALRDETLTNPKVMAAEGTEYHIGYNNYNRPVKDADKKVEVEVMNIGHSYAQTVGLRLKEGRLFDEERSAADISGGSVIVNQKLVDAFGWKEAIGKTVTVYDTTKLTVIGVVEDFYFSGVWNTINPMILRQANPADFSFLAVRAKKEDLPVVLDFIHNKWKTISSTTIFDGVLQEDNMQEEKDVNNSILKINLFLALTALILSLIGMFNLVSLDIIRRTKEMGIRKIQGAPVSLIMYLVSKKFLLILCISSVLGCALGYYLSNMLMDSIWDYFVTISPGMLLIAVFIISGATILTLVTKIAKAAMRNPVISLRYE